MKKAGQQEKNELTIQDIKRSYCEVLSFSITEALAIASERIGNEMASCQLAILYSGKIYDKEAELIEAQFDDLALEISKVISRCDEALKIKLERALTKILANNFSSGKF